MRKLLLSKVFTIIIGGSLGFAAVASYGVPPTGACSGGEISGVCNASTMTTVACVECADSILALFV